MDLESSQKNVDRLARIRENQRKSRARKQEYVRELEQRLSSYKNDAQQKDIQHRLATQKLEAENRQLKALLGSLGISAESIQQYLQLAHQGTAFNQKVAIPAMQRPTEPRALSPSGLSETDRRIDSKHTSVSNVSSTSSTPRHSSYSTTIYTPVPDDQPKSGCMTPDSTACAPSSCAPSSCAPTSYATAKCGPASCAPTSCASSSCEPTRSDYQQTLRSQEPFQGPVVLQQTQHLQPQQQQQQQQQQPYPYPQAVESQLEPLSQQEQQSQQETRLRPLLLQKQPEGLSHPAEQQPKENNPSFCQCGPGDDLPAGEGDLLNTTLCGMAEELINQYNTVGIDIDEIRKRLWAGFKAGATGDGCRVENQVLFQVLDEISNGI
ncbi:BZIP transcription factor [Penicillium ucsense]|uniref:BZIP transcription factor n=1 Tax=Penicillium ucsense TaxID=2839758 RepID=A0A8J8W9G7_9EURO|nr:BZIP transcription factor [Penicillium ucsense]KAF7739307.1 BZIP transcription factor [Penicillium ucsense]